MKYSEISTQVSKAVADGEFDRAMELLAPIAESGDAEAQYRLGALRYKGANISVEDAYGWLEKAASQNHPDALFYWASYCRPGEPGLIIKAAELGSTAAQYHLGVCYALGDDGYRKDESEAIKWYEMAAKAGDAGAQYNLGSMLFYGEGTKKNLVQARHWLYRAARQGHEQAKRLLSEVSRDVDASNP